MTALKIIGCILLFFAFILSLRAKITVEYSDEVRLSVRVLCFKIKILPSKKKKKGPHSMSAKKAQKIKEALQKKAKKKRLKKQKKKLEKEQQSNLTKKKKSLGEILDMIKMIKDILSAALKKFFGHLRVDLARIKITVATGDAATTAIAYGAVCEAMFHLLPILESIKGFDTPNVRDISVDTDYLSDTMKADVKISLALRVWHVFDVAFAALGVLIKYLMTKKFQR